MAKRFETTRWSMILAARDGQSSESRQALEQLCQMYWFPVYSYICRRGNRIEQAQDLTQEFFTRFLEKQFLRKVEQERGRFRSFLLASVSNFLADEWDKREALKRGGGTQDLTLDFATAERLWRSLKCEEVYLTAYENIPQVREGICQWIHFYNQRRRHQALEKRTPDTLYYQNLNAEAMASA